MTAKKSVAAKPEKPNRACVEGGAMSASPSYPALLAPRPVDAEYLSRRLESVNNEFDGYRRGVREALEALSIKIRS